MYYDPVRQVPAGRSLEIVDMPPKASAADIENAVADYLAGEGAEAVAARHGTSQSRLKAILVECGQWRTREQTNAFRARRTSAGLLARSDLPTSEIVRRYQDGESVNALAQAFDVSRRAIELRLVNAGVELRSIKDANRLLASKRTPEENARLIRAAHAATRGVPMTFERKAKSAATRERHQVFVTPTERHLAELLTDRGCEVTPQKAVGPYNVDIATGSVAVEIFGGGWHAYGVHRARSAERFRYILDQGWNLVIMWVVTQRWPLKAEAADYIAAFADLTRRDPSIRGQYRVIWGDGKESTSNGLNVDDLSAMPTRSGRKRPGPRHQGARD